ncbi:MAG TPA: hypothetical protein ENI17_13090 [Pseudomonas xinjiangensis]|uniref:DUF883 domain-containing protein n=2 Tax=root TaxID=1 RepID=A0A7V1FRJ5_9GAMM|nr:hypothetical protein [Halopseudomonas xinjiangensis]HEC48547.1 hypothetical protein [Halopseudomonas xinjiangensis]
MVGSNNVEDAVDKAKQSLKNSQDKFKSGESGKEIDSGKEAVMAAFDKLMEAKAHFMHAAEASGLDMKSGASGQMNKGKAKAQELSSQATTFVHEKPLAALGIAFAAGFVVSKLCTTSR